MYGGYATAMNPVFSGALYANPDNNKVGSVDGPNSPNAHPGYGFDASRNSVEYVTGASLQPAALSVLACIKL